MSYFFCGQTGNVNRGCEAIVRSTVKVLGVNNGDIHLATYSPASDRPMVRALGINMVSYDTYPTSVHRMVCGTWRKIFRGSVAGAKYKMRSLCALLKEGDITLNIGGDTYCYGRPEFIMAFNKYAQKNKLNNYFWCCSVEKSAITKEVKQDLERYNKIFAREQITFDNIISSGVDREKVVKVCDPAFFLDMQEVDLPLGFVKGNTVGLNVSECVLKKDDQYVYSNVINLAKYILNETDMSICLIPHVYSIERNVSDWPILQKIRKDLNSDKVSIVDKEYNCEQLKFIISNCRYMVCARTHASIAAYSSCVPTLVLGYSVKSKGIARDLFGTDENYVVSYADLTEKQELTAAFKFIEQNEDAIRTRLTAFLPEYKRQLSDAVAKYIVKENKTEKFEICDPSLCTGCSACVSSCPKSCIEMKPDKDGFLYPEIDDTKCISCGKCRNTCPVLNRYKDDNKEPEVMAAVNKKEDVRLNSSSGGVFSALAEKIISEGGVVFGAAYDKDFKVVHRAAENAEEIKAFRGSKYVQSEIGDSYRKAKEALESGRAVLFTGTPCQIGGLYACLNKEYDNLYTQDFICHGVPSPKVWKKYVKYREQAADSKTVNVSFRNKQNGWKRFSMRFDFVNGKDYTQILSNDLYMQGFLSHLFLRSSCHHCAFKNMHRKADITLADFWGVERIYPKRNDDKGVSLVMLQSEKGNALWVDVAGEFEHWQVPFADAIKSNSSYLRSFEASPLRERFLSDVDKMPVDKAIEKYCSLKPASKARRFISKL